MRKGPSPSRGKYRMICVPTVPGRQPETILLDRVVPANTVVGVQGIDSGGATITVAFSITMHVFMPEASGMEQVMIAARTPQFDTLVAFLDGIPIPMADLQPIEDPEPTVPLDDPTAMTVEEAAAAFAAQPIIDAPNVEPTPEQVAAVLAQLPNGDTVH